MVAAAVTLLLGNVSTLANSPHNHRVAQHPPTQARPEQNNPNDTRQSANNNAFIVRFPPAEFFPFYHTQDYYGFAYPDDGEARYASDNNDIQRGLVEVGIAQAVTYLIQAVLLALVLGATIRQAKAANQQAQVANDTFRWSHRPKIRIKHIWLTSEIWEGKPIEVKVLIVNSGTAPSQITNFKLLTCIQKKGEDLPAELELGEGRSLTGELPPGMTWVISQVSDGRILTDDDNGALRSGERVLYCVGQVEHRPPWAKVDGHTTHFCRKLKIPRSARHATMTEEATGRFRFYVHHDPDYEYQD